MVICGIKTTHDSSVAIIEDGKLIFSVELEKKNNNRRYYPMKSLEEVVPVIEEFGYKVSDIDLFVIDGWHNLVDEKSKGKEECYVKLEDQLIRVAPYDNSVLGIDEETEFGTYNLRLDGKSVSYSSFSHIYTHLCSCYCTSPFARKNENSFVFVWDGGSRPKLYYYSNEKFEFLEDVFKLGGDILVRIACMFAPFKRPDNGIDYKCAGKVMAYAALGDVKKEIVDIFYEIYEGISEKNYAYDGFIGNVEFADKVRQMCVGIYDSKDIISSLHYFLEEIIVKHITRAINDSGYKCNNLCMSGGCALNIKWNTAIRESSIVKNMYVPPFTNDSGSAIGAACAGMFHNSNNTSVEWNLYCGPKVIDKYITEGWTKEKCNTKELAKLIFETKEPVVVLLGRAEVGPRALGNRSILADATTESMKSKLNYVKKREEYRPVAPICIEEDAPMYFSPGTPDRFMLYDHEVVGETTRVPAVKHIDGTARLQTVSQKDNPIIYDLLCEYKKISGISVLCNTSANNCGTGFFPDVASAQIWGRCSYIWDGVYLFKKQK